MLKGNEQPRQAAGVTTRPAATQPLRVTAPVARADVRPAPPQAQTPSQLLTSVGDLPHYKRILTAVGSAYEIPPHHRAHFIALQLANEHAWILVEPQFRQTQSVHITNLRRNLEQNGVHVEKVVGISKELISDLYDSTGRVNGAQAETDNAEEKRLFDELVQYGYKIRASDIHIEVRGTQGNVRFRVHSDLEPMKTAGRGVYITEPLALSISYAYNKLGEEGTHSHGNFNMEEMQSCMIPYVLDGKQVNLRYQSIRVHDGFDVVLRYLQQRDFRKINSFVDLGYAPDHAEMMMASNANRKGITVVSGIPGSGKSTSLKWMIRHMRNRSKMKIFMIEDPMEEPVEGVSHISVQRSMKSGSEKRPYSEIQTILLRANADACVMGEIRDIETAECSRALLESGIKTQATLHAHSIMGMFPRLTEPKIGFTIETLTQQQFLNLLITQSLVPVLCTHCRLPAHEHIPETVDYVADRFRLDTSNMYIKNPDGCEHCEQRGTTDSTVVAEMIAPDRRFLQLMREGKDFDAELHWRSTCDKRYDSPYMKGKTIFEHALYKAYLGVIDLTVVERFESFDRYEKLWQDD